MMPQLLAIPANNMYRRALVASNRRLVCACNAYSWLHRRGFGQCPLVKSALLTAATLNLLNRLIRELSLELEQQRRAI